MPSSEVPPRQTSVGQLSICSGPLLRASSMTIIEQYSTLPAQFVLGDCAALVSIVI